MRITKLLVALTLALCTYVQGAIAQQPIDYTLFQERFNIYVGADLGRNGYYDQKEIAETMGRLAEQIEPEFVIGAGDIHHFDGVASVDDPLWMTNYELIYSHPELMIDWFNVMGNHEYRGNTQAVMDYSKKSRRWNVPSRYYTKSFDEEGCTMRVVFIDTTPLIDKYRNNKEKYPDASKQDMQAQLSWLEEVLAAATEDWVVVVGHHPIYADTYKKPIERENLQQRVDTLLRKYNVDLYVCGHIHSFQHLRMEGSDIEYVVNGSGSLSRDVKAIEGTQFCSGVSGFSIISASATDLQLHMIDKVGNVIYTLTHTK